MSERTLNDMDVYQHLTRVAGELESLAAISQTLIGETALKTAAQTVRGMANAVYEHSLADGAH
ncbi:hypothetical protein [Phenylobacterium sp.]|uniref:hypothetical protein n=1 Tax=Phenylobacterium sp. TaxID=1871053 RepID=UPI002F91CEDF